jgi:hypothetical protein
MCYGQAEETVRQFNFNISSIKKMPRASLVRRICIGILNDSNPYELCHYGSCLSGGIKYHVFISKELFAKDFISPAGIPILFLAFL